MCLPGILPDSNFSLDVVEVMHDFIRMMSKEALAIIVHYVCIFV